MYRTVALILTAAGLAVCAPKNYTITLSSPAIFAGTELKAGAHKLTVDGDSVTVDGKADTKTTAKLETAATKYGSTSLRLNLVDGKQHLQEVRLGGTNTKLVLNEAGTSTGNRP